MPSAPAFASAASSGSGRPQPPITVPPVPPGVPSSYVTSYASPLKSSRVGAVRRAYASLDRIAFGWPGGTTPEARRLKPRFLFAASDGAHLVVDWGSSFDFRDGSGKYLGGGEKTERFDLTAGDDAYYIYGNEALYSGAATTTVKANSGFSPEGAMLAFKFDATRRLIMTQLSPVAPHGGGNWAVQLYGDRFAKPDRSFAELVMWGGFDGKGMAAIGPDWRTVVAMEDGTLRVLSDVGDADKHPAALLQVKLPYVVSTLSLAPPLILATSSSAAGTTVHALDPSGAEKWRVVVPFGVQQPPVDGTGRVVVIGSGIASIDDGKIVWSQVAPAGMLGTAFADGTLALGVGSELRIVDREGTILQALKTAAGETITTPPCILADGTVWVATEKALYVAR